MYIIIAGGGKVGYYLAEELLTGDDNELLIIEKSSARVAEIGDRLDGTVMVGDACEASVLDGAGVSRAGLVAAVTGEDEDNLVICEVARYRGVPRVLARVNDPKNAALFKKRGIETTVSATEAILGQIEQELPVTEMIPVMQLHHGLELVEVRLSDTSPAVGRSPREILLPPEALVALIVDSGGVPRIPGADTTLTAGDALVVVARAESRNMLKEALIGGTHGFDT